MSLLIVDVQPEYDIHYPTQLVRDIIEEAQKHDRVSMFWVGGQIHDTSLEEVIDYWEGFRPPEGFTSKIQYHEKEYGYLCDWLARGTPKEFVVNAIKRMVALGITDSLDLPPDDIYQLRMLDCPPGWRIREPEGNIILPEWDYEAFRGTDWLTCGGHEEECLPEVEALLEGHGIRCTRLPHLVW